MIEIRKLDESYKGYPLEFHYQTDSYYEISVVEQGEDYSIQMELTPMLEKAERYFEDRLMEDWLDNPLVYGAFVDQDLAGILELSYESWNQRLRISNILVFEKYRRMHLGIYLMKEAIREGMEIGARALILETQSFNVPAIRFYRQCGFLLAGFDVNCYGDYDMEKKEVRVDMTRELKGMTVDYCDIPLERLVKESLIRKTLSQKLSDINPNYENLFLKIPKSIRQIKEVFQGEPLGISLCNQIMLEFDKEDLRRPISMERAFPKLGHSDWKFTDLEISLMKVNLTSKGRHLGNIRAVRNGHSTQEYQFSVVLEMDQALQSKDVKNAMFEFRTTEIEEEWIVSFESKEKKDEFLKSLLLKGTIEIC